MLGDFQMTSQTAHIQPKSGNNEVQHAMMHAKCARMARSNAHMHRIDLVLVLCHNSRQFSRNVHLLPEIAVVYESFKQKNLVYVGSIYTEAHQELKQTVKLGHRSDVIQHTPAAGSSNYQNSRRYQTFAADFIPFRVDTSMVKSWEFHQNAASGFLCGLKPIF